MARLQLALKRMEFEGLGFSLVLLPGWKGVAMNPLHGGFISLAEHGQEAVLNVRGLSAEELEEVATELAGQREALRLVGSGSALHDAEPALNDATGPLDASALERLLRSLEWNTPPADLSSWESKPYAVAGATFPPAGERPEWVREWFITDGKNLANAMATPLICRNPEMLAECEEMLRSLRFG